jgi:hypothetical protein
MVQTSLRRLEGGIEETTEEIRGSSTKEDAGALHAWRGEARLRVAGELLRVTKLPRFVSA